MIERQQIRDFSKVESEDERAETASNIKEKRAEHFKWKSKLESDIQELTSKGHSTATSLERINSDVAAAEKEILEREQSLFQRFFEYIGAHRRMTDLRVEHKTKEVEREELEEQFAETSKILEELEQMRNDRKYLDEAEKILADFYKDQEQKISEFKIDQQEIRDVQRISRENHATFIHGVHPTFVPGSNSLMRPEVDWQTKFKVFLAFNPTVSTSTIRDGDTSDRMWARQGFIVTRGSVQIADSADAGTVAEGLDVKKTWSSSKSKMTEGDISKALLGSVDGHNEFVVSKPGIAGFFICREMGRRTGRTDLAPIEEIIEECVKLGLPVYEMKDGQIWETEVSADGKDITLVKPIPFDELSDREFSIPQLDREGIEQEILSNSPFNAWPSEARYIESRARGRELYIMMNRKNFLKMEGKKEVFSDSRATSYEGKKMNKSKVEVLSEFPSIGKKNRYYRTADGGLYKHTISSIKHKSKVSPVTHGPNHNMSHGANELQEITEYAASGTRDSSYIMLTFSSHDTGELMTSNKAYLKGMEKSLGDLIVKRDKTISERNKIKDSEWHKSSYDDWINEVVFHLYGFAEQARECGDVETEKEAMRIAGKILSPESYRDVLDRRIDDDGRFKIKKEEIRR